MAQGLETKCGFLCLNSDYINQLSGNKLARDIGVLWCLCSLLCPLKGIKILMFPYAEIGLSFESSEASLHSYGVYTWAQAKPVRHVTLLVISETCEY